MAQQLKRQISLFAEVKWSEIALSLVAIFAFSVAQPLLDLLGRNPEFFLARAAPKLDIWLLTLTVTVALPGILALISLAARAISLVLGAVVHWVLFVAMAGALAVALMEHSPAAALPDWIEIALGAVVGASLWDVFLRFATARTLFRFASAGTVVFAIAFLAFSPTSQLLRASGSLERPVGITVESPAPVVMVIFDEFPIASLIDSNGNIPEDLYPAFARLAGDGIWFRNAVGVEQQTEEAIPTILTGRHPADRDAIPTASDYPLNLFSLLSDTYEIRASESVTELCPEYACANRSRPVSPASVRWPALATDLSIVSAHLLLPSEMASGLPTINQTWGDFSGATPEARQEFNLIKKFNENLDDDRRTQVARFLDMLEQPTDQPTVYYAHILFPHVPWAYLPTGQSYTVLVPAPGSTSIGWESDEWLVMQAYQRHLAQVQYTDAIVGEIIQTLERQGIYDDALIVMVADHGSADAPDIDFRRAITDETIGHIAAVPLFVKLPGTEKGFIDDYRAETTDVLPTIADALGITVPWRVEGTSLLSEDRPVRTSSTMFGSRGKVTFDTSGIEKLEVAEWKESWFLDGNPFGLAPKGYHDILGMTLDGLEAGTDAELSVNLTHPHWFADVALDTEPFPAQITGTATRSTGWDGDVVIAVSLNGLIEAVVRTYDTEGTSTKFQALLNPEAFVPGQNQIDLILIDGSDGDFNFTLIGGT